MRVITLDINKTVISVKNVGNNYNLNSNDIISDLGEIGQIMQVDGTFVTPEPVPVEPTKSLEEQILQLKENQVATNRAIDETSTTQQELLELLMETGVIS